MQIIETSIHNASGFSTDFFHTLIKQRRILLQSPIDTYDRFGSCQTTLGNKIKLAFEP
ncbi:hypothetical protein QUA11_31430 [Microcoleus sp. S13_D1]